MKQKIIPHLWYDTQAKEAAEFYTSVFPNSKIFNITTLHDTPSGDCDVVSFQLSGYQFMAVSAGPFFKVNPSISFGVFFKTKEEVDALWNQLIQGGKALMEIDAYPWSDRYGWVQDRFGVSWQIVPTIMDEMMKDHDSKRLTRVTQAFLQMKKFDIAKLEEAAKGE